jgi:hypothetical protein
MKNCKDLASNIFSNQQLMAVLDTTIPIVVSSKDDGDLDFDLPGFSSSTASNFLGDSPNIHDMFERLCSYVEMAFHGFGGGAMHHNETLRITKQQLKWHHGTIYYESTPEKRPAVNAPDPKPVQRKLPACQLLGKDCFFS